MKIAIVDDEKLWIQKAYLEIRKHFGKEEAQVYAFTSGERFLSAKEAFDIVVLDVEMNGKDGFDTAKEYKQRYPDACIMMLTGHLEMSRKGYLVDAFRYVDKMKMAQELAEAFFAVKKLQGRNQTVKIHVVGTGDLPVVCREIVYIETVFRRLLVHTYQQTYTCSDTMKSMEEMLPQTQFYRCHKSYLVNLDAVVRIEKAFVFLADGSRIEAGIKKLPVLKKKYMERKFECANK